MWPFSGRCGEWGSDRQAVMDYLKREWKRNNTTHPTESTRESTRREATSILKVWMFLLQNISTISSQSIPFLSSFPQWWWQCCYNQTTPPDLNSYPDYFAAWLLRKFKDNVRVNPDDNIVPGPGY